MLDLNISIHWSPTWVRSLFFQATPLQVVEDPQFSGSFIGSCRWRPWCFFFSLETISVSEHWAHWPVALIVVGSLFYSKQWGGFRTVYFSSSAPDWPLQVRSWDSGRRQEERALKWVATLWRPVGAHGLSGPLVIIDLVDGWLSL